MKINLKPGNIARWMIRRKWLVISAMFLIAITAASGVRYLRINNDYHEFFSEENPQLKAYDALQPLMFAVIIVLLLVATKNIWATIGACLVVFLSMFSGLGIAGWLGFKLSGPVFSAPNMIMTLAVADSVHILVKILHFLRKGYCKEEAIVETYKTNFSPILLTTITTVCGFLTLNFSDSPPFRVLGNITAIGMVAAYFYSFFLLPALIAVLPVKSRAYVKTSQGSFLLERFSEFIIRFRKKIFWTSALVVLLMGAFIFY